MSRTDYIGLRVAHAPRDRAELSAYSAAPGIRRALDELDGYVLNAKGDAVERRSIFVQVAGLRYMRMVRQPGRRPVLRTPINSG